MLINWRDKFDMLILALDTTTFCGSVALLENQRLIGEVNLDSPVTFSERLLPAVELLLKFSRCSLQDIDGYAVSVGPGSFTGIRIGLSTIKALALASGRPVAPVSTLKALAWKLREAPISLISPVIDAKKGEIYTALYRKEEKELKLKEKILPGAYQPDDFLAQIPQNQKIGFLGSGLVVYGQKIKQIFQEKAIFYQRTNFIAFEIGLLGGDLLQAGKGILAHEVQPLYLRKSQAEEKNR